MSQPTLIDTQNQPMQIKSNNTEFDSPQHQCIHQLFESQVERTPDATAVVFENQQLTYRSLNARANQLAHYLKRQRVEPEILVGLAVERSLDMLVGLLGILKAGGAYVPLDPAYPKKRLAAILSDAQVSVLLTQKALMAGLPQHHAYTVCLDTDLGAISQERNENLINRATPNNLAYVIYTSGSTGLPKGVAIQHNSVINLSNGLYQTIYAHYQNAPLRVSLNGSLAFDTSVKQIIQLLYGHTVDIIPESLRYDGKALLDYLISHQIDVFDCTPSQLELLIADGLLSKSLSAPKIVLIGGEPINESTWQALAQNIHFYNVYGPTECTVDATVCQVRTSAQPVIGRPLPNVQTYILDHQLQPVPNGEAGELHIGGVGLARGYLNHPELTAEKFIPNPFYNDPESRLYKTGDLTRYLPEGTLEFLGRTDSQVKLRGFRIELGEIETVLTQHPDIQQAVVTVREEALTPAISQTENATDKRLVSYIVPKPSRAPTIAGKPRYTLPNKLAIAHLNQNETDFLYKEIFEVKAYLKHGITIKDGDCIFDVGTNIGLFSLFAHINGNNVKLYGFEPNPFVFEILELNTKLYEVDAKLFNCGLSRQTTTANFTFYPKFSFLSGLYADTADEKEIVKSFLLNQQGAAEAASLAQQNDELLEELLADKFKSKTFTVQLRTLSDIIQQHNIEHIDLLKINVEKSEWDVLAGIAEADWHKIHQIALEVHDINGRLEQVLTLFEKQGYQTVVEQDWSFDKTAGINYYLYAIRESRQDLKARQSKKVLSKLPEPILTCSELRDFLNKRLPDYMVPSAFVMLEGLPLTPNGKIDRQALPAPDKSQWSHTDNYVAPSTPTEKLLARLWHEVLKVGQIGIHDNFFELGGHSLLATRIISRVRETFQTDIPISVLFDKPTVATLAAQIDSRVPLKSLESLTVPVGIKSEALSHEVDTAPLSITQQSFWLFEQLHPNTPTFNIPLAYKLTGTLNFSVLKQALSEMVRRHATLRTHFEVTETGTPQQRIIPPASYSVTVIDLRSKKSETKTQQVINEEIRRPFDLGQAYLWRATVLRRHEQEQILLLTFHHLITDGWSAGFFIQELTELYATFIEDKVLPKMVGYQYLDFCRWQTQCLQSEQYQSQLAYWQSQLKGPLPILDLPTTDYPRPPVQSYQGALQPIIISPSLTTALNKFSHQQDVTLFMTLLATFKTLLYRYTGQTDLIIGSAAAGRQRVEWEKVIGVFINNLVFRTHPSGQISFTSFLNQVREKALAAYSNQDLPFQSLVDRIQPERDLSYHPLFQVFFLLQNFDLPNLNLAGLKTIPLDTCLDNIYTGTAKFDLTLELFERDGKLTGWFEYNTALFSAATMQRMAGHFQTLLESIVAAPETPLSTLPLLTETERQRLCRSDANIRPTNPFIEFTKADIEQSIPERFEQQVKKYPHHLAVKTKHEALTYLELNQQANQVARTLLKHRIGGEKNIGLLFEHEASMIVGILGVLKAGLTYVPLAPELPAKRLVYILEDSQASVVLTNHKQLALAQELSRGVLPVININQISPNPLQKGSRERFSPDTIAYILYTSGSTGQPKGVVQNHRNVLHFIRNYTNNLHINADDKLTLLPAYSFDAAVMDIFAALLNGATLYPINIKEDSLANPVNAFINKQQITIYHSTPTVYRHFISTLTEGDHFPKLRLIVLGGEEVYKSDVELYQQQFSDNCLFINGLGPTESTVTLQYFINKRTSNPQPTVPIGYPVEETEIVLLNEAGEETELYGEIAIKSAYVALGYWQKPETTQAAFRPHGNRRLYRTGDMGRLRANGSLEFVGRKDSQVKLRGYRIELGEIEATLGQHPAVQQTAVILWEEQPRLLPLGDGRGEGEKRIVAYMVLHHKDGLEKIGTDELRQFLKEKLPDYMVPSAFIRVEAIPLLPNGKVNRRLLPVPELNQATIIAPRNPLERQLTNIWQKVLGTQPIGIHDNFFDQGGHSLLAITLLTQIEKTFGKRLPLITLFQAPTVAQQANTLREQNHTVSWRALEAVRSQGTRPPFFLMGNSRLARALLPLLEPDQPVYGLNVLSLQPSDSTTPLSDIKEIAKQCIQEIQTVQPQGPYYLGGYCIDAPVAFEIAQQLHANGQKVALLALFDAFLNRIPQWQQGYSLNHHWLNLLELGPSYLLQKIRQKWQRSVREVQLKLLGKQGKKLTRRNQKTLPSQLHYTLFINAYRQAVANYVPQPFQGRIALFFASEWRVKDTSAFAPLATTGEVEIYEILGYHDILFVSPQVEVLGEQLKHCLENN